MWGTPVADGPTIATLCDEQVLATVVQKAGLAGLFHAVFATSHCVRSLASNCCYWCDRSAQTATTSRHPSAFGAA